MAKNTNIQSVEPNIADLVNGWLKSYKLDYKLEQESLNTEIDQALNDYFSKNGGKGGNRPDAKLLLRANDGKYYPILIEYKGYKNRLVKLDAEGNVANKTSKNQPDFTNINSYAVNGAVHYSNAVLHYTSYTDVIAIGVTGYKEASGKLKHLIGVYYVSKSNFGVGQKVDEYTDLSFLKKEHFSAFIEKVKQLSLSQEEIDKLKERREEEITASLVKLNNDIFKSEKGLSENDRVYLVVASIMATLGDVDNNVYPLTKADLKSSDERNNTDGDIVLRKIESFLDAKKLPKDKKDLIVRTLQNTLTTDNINKVEDGESQLKRVFIKIVDDLGIYYKIGLTTDFTGKLFNEMYSWLGFTQDQLNDVVLTPPYVATLLCRLARVNQDSFVWDFATGSAGLLVAAMNEMLVDAKKKIKSPEELVRKSAEIKANQLLGLEILSNVYMLAVLNMIMMGDGSSNILNKDSLKFDGHYGFGKTDEKFPADAFILNPPYSAEGNGMIFVEKALSMMEKGYAAIIIQNSAGSGKATEYNKRILEHSTLLASIKMPIDLFIGKSSVQTNVYVFRVGEAHQKDDVVKFIDFANDGYTRSNRKKASKNLFDTDRAKERYQEVVDLVRFGKSKLSIFTEKEYYEGHIDPQSGNDWNQTAPIDTKPTLDDFKKTVSDYLAWEVSTLLKNQPAEDDRLGK
ncbi:MAG: class I SAM-dependent DNA methyltransferase [Agathobaculum desmolans]|uniref:HsdM family class I SAM-dependent methyltransferase n=1 Tax=Agathobaculum desmolans TaxID=39484 RepID=UPI003995EF8E